MANPRKGLFCCCCLKETNHVVLYDDNAEYTLVCDCNNFVKFPSCSSLDELKTMVEAHNAHNTPFLTEAQARKAALIQAQQILEQMSQEQAQ